MLLTRLVIRDALTVPDMPGMPRQVAEREYKRQQRQCLDNLRRLKKSISVLEEKLAKHKKIDADSYHFQKFGLNKTNSKVMKETGQQLTLKKKVHHNTLVFLDVVLGKYVHSGRVTSLT